MTITLITGANKGLGYETARRLIEHGHEVIVGARDRERGEAAAAELGARFVQLDVTSDESVAAAIADIGAHEGRLDVLVNNAGIPGPQSDAADLTADDARAVYEVNVFGVLRVTHAALPLLRASASPAVVNVTSGLGSFAATHDASRIESRITAPLYTSSKAALTMLTTQLAKGLPGIRVNAADPGYTATDFNGNSGHQTVSEGTDAIVALATAGPEGATGTFTDRSGIAPW